MEEKKTLNNTQTPTNGLTHPIYTQNFVFSSDTEHSRKKDSSHAFFAIRAVDKFCRKKGGLLIHTTYVGTYSIGTYLYILQRKRWEAIQNITIYFRKKYAALFIDKKLMNLNRLFCVCLCCYNTYMFLKGLFPNWGKNISLVV